MWKGDYALAVRTTTRLYMEELQEILERTLNEIPRVLLERRLAEKFKAAGFTVSEATLSKVVTNILTRGRDSFELNTGDGEVVIRIKDEDLELVERAVERFLSEKLDEVLATVSEEAVDLLFKSLIKKWPEEFKSQRADVDAFKERLEHRWGKALGRFRMLITIVMEWISWSYERRRKANDSQMSHLDDVMIRLNVRACQVANEIVVLLENGYADGAMARWRTLHEITIVAAVIAKYGNELAERYVHYQIVESFSALKAYERNHKDLGFKPPSRALAAKVRKDYAKVLQRFGKEFGQEYGWAAHHLQITGKGRVTFARLEEEAGAARMRSPYKMASYNVHASPKGVYFKLGSFDGSPSLLAGATNAGLTEPAQHAAVSLAEITLLSIGDTAVFDDIVAGKIVGRLETQTLEELSKADKKLRRDERRHRKAASEESP